MKNKSVLEEADDIRRAVEMVSLGARMQMLEAETKLSRERLLRIYKEVRGMSPPKGMRSGGDVLSVDDSGALQPGGSPGLD